MSRKSENIRECYSRYFNEKFGLNIPDDKDAAQLLQDAIFAFESKFVTAIVGVQQLLEEGSSTEQAGEQLFSYLTDLLKLHEDDILPLAGLELAPGKWLIKNDSCYSFQAHAPLGKVRAISYSRIKLCFERSANPLESLAETVAEWEKHLTTDM